MPLKPHIHTSDLQGITRLITRATVGITDIVELVHRRIVHPPFLPSTPVQHLISGISGLVYKGVRHTSQLIGDGLDRSFGLLQSVQNEALSSKERDATRAVLNGVLGDFLEESDNPLSIPMQLRFQGKELKLDAESMKAAYPNVNGKILLMVHGLCMNDKQWRHKGHDHGEALANELGLTPVYLYYNSGRHISVNGKNLHALLEQLVQNWPEEVEELHIVAHSMGGLISRSAIHYAEKVKSAWTHHLKKIVFMGTPHHGARMEQVGNYIDIIFEATPYVKPFARLGKIRSAGITDLRYGNLLDEDWAEVDRFAKRPDKRKHIPLPQSAECFNIVATTGKKKEDPSARLSGDGIVYLNSALGQHKDPNKTLAFKKAHSWIIHESGHLDLLTNAKVYDVLKGCLAS